MAKESTVQIVMDTDLKEQVELLYKKLGTSFAEAVRIFAKQSIQENGMPFIIHIPEQKIDQRIGIAKGKISIPNDIDKYNNEISDIFGGI